MKKLLFSIGFAVTAFAATAQNIDATEVSKVPWQAAHDGKLLTAYTWNDANGKNYFILARTDDKQGKDKNGNDATSASFYAYHYAGKTDSEQVLLRKIQDFVNDCPFDLTLNPETESVTFTDLDGDKKAEITFVYRLACRSDVSGADQKLMLLENGDKYAIRGTCGIVMPMGDDQGTIIEEKGTMNVGSEFDKVPKFLQHAKKVWQDFEVESFFE